MSSQFFSGRPSKRGNEYFMENPDGERFEIRTVQELQPDGSYREVPRDDWDFAFERWLNPEKRIEAEIEKRRALAIELIRAVIWTFKVWVVAMIGLILLALLK